MKNRKETKSEEHSTAPASTVGRNAQMLGKQNAVVMSGEMRLKTQDLRNP